MNVILNSIWTMWMVFLHAFRRRETVLYPEKKPELPARWRGRIVLTRDPDGHERCVACYLCSAVCPTACINLQAIESPDGRRVAEHFRINFSRCIFCGFCEEACPTRAIQLTPDFEMGEYVRQNLVYEKDDLLIAGTGKYHDYNYYKHCGLKIDGKEKGEAKNEAPPVDVRRLMP